MSLNPRLGSTERGAWGGVGRKGWQRVGESLAKGWRRVGGFLCTLQLCHSRSARSERLVCDSMVNCQEEVHVELPKMGHPTLSFASIEISP